MPLALSILLLGVALITQRHFDNAWILYAIAYLPIGLPIIGDAMAEIREGDVFNEYTLMIIASAGAFGIGEYPEAVAVLLFYSIGEYFQDRAVGHARRDIQALINVRPDVATVITPDGERKQVSPDEVAVGDTIEVKAGGRVPLDGELLTAAADFDTAALTGEANPRTITTGSEVQAGMISVDKVVKLRTVRLAHESALSRILAMVEDATQHKSPAETFIRRFAHIYTPVVIALAVLVAIVPPLAFNGMWSDWFHRALVFLVISCPCALVVSVPLAYYRGIGVASRHGILFKGGNYLDAVADLSAVVFDKTGTLTRGRFEVASIVCGVHQDSEHVLRLAALLEQHSSHPIAQAILAAYKGDKLDEVTNLEEMAGYGLRGYAAGKEILVGKRTLLEKENIKISQDFQENEAFTYVYVATMGNFAGVIALRDMPKPDAATAISKLSAQGITNTCVLSGDRTPVVEALAHELGIGEAHGDLLPQDKARYLTHIMHRTKGGKVAFVGDGINDAPVLALSHVGFAMGGAGSDAAVETADVVLQNDSPTSVAQAIHIARTTRHLVFGNIALALGIKLLVLIISVFGIANLWLAVFADTGVTLICVLNTYFIKK